MPDYRYASNQVAAVEQNQGPAQRPRVDGLKQWPPRNDYPRKQFEGPKKWQPREKFTYEQMLDRPCSHHSQLLGRPSDHINRQCAWTARMSRGDGILPPPPPRPPQLTGANALPVATRPTASGNDQQRENVNQVRDGTVTVAMSKRSTRLLMWYLCPSQLTARA